MALVRHETTEYFKDQLSGHYLSTNFNDGDTVAPIVNNLSNITHGKPYTIVEARRSASLYETKRRNGTYDYVYEQKLIIQDDRGFRKEVRAKNFALTKAVPPVATILAIETNRPTVVVEIKETTTDGKIVIQEVGVPVPTDSLSAARVYTANAISEAIREKNEYKQFRVYQEAFIARAKKPEIEFA